MSTAPRARINDIVEYMERWARWRARGTRFIGVQYAGHSILWKIMQGMRSTNCPACRGQGKMPGWRIGSDLQWIDPCPQCSGAGRVKGDLESLTRSVTFRCPDCDKHPKTKKPTGEKNGKTCHKCRGSGKRTLIYEKVNPAGINSTRPYGVVEDEDPISALIDRMVAGWKNSDETYWLHAVICMEYAKHGTQEGKSRSLRISQSWYSKNLAKAHERLKAAIEEAFDAGIISA